MNCDMSARKRMKQREFKTLPDDWSAIYDTCRVQKLTQDAIYGIIIDNLDMSCSQPDAGGGVEKMERGNVPRSIRRGKP